MKDFVCISSMNSKDLVSSLTIYFFNYLFIYTELGFYMAQAGVEFFYVLWDELELQIFWFLLVPYVLWDELELRILLVPSGSPS